MKSLTTFFTIKRIILFSLLTVIIVGLALLGRPANIDHKEFSTLIDDEIEIANDAYAQVERNYVYLPSEVEIIVEPEDLGMDLIDGTDYGYFGSLFALDEKESLDFNVIVPSGALFNIEIDYVDVSEYILSNELTVLISDELPFEESRIIKLPARWVFDTDEFPLDRYENETMPSSVKQEVVQTVRLNDTTALNQAPLKYQLETGSNKITFSVRTGRVLIGQIRFVPPVELPTYAEYLDSHDAQMGTDELIISAKEITAKNNPSIRLTSDNDPSAISYDTRIQRLNAIDGYSTRSGNDAIEYSFVVSDTGYYYLGVKFRQDFLMQMPVFRELKLDGEIPFVEASALVFHYTKDYQNLLFGEDEPYLFYLEAGLHTLSLRTVLEPYRDVHQAIVWVMEEITDLSLEIKKLTGNNSDQYRSWKLATYIPDIEARLQSWLDTLNLVVEHLSQYSHQSKPGQLTNLKLAIERLTSLKSDVDEIPSKMILLSDGDTSVAQLLGSFIQYILQNGLDVQTIYVTGNEKLPNPEANIFKKAYESTLRFFLSFSKRAYQVQDVEEDTLDVWVNHPRQYIEIMQMMIDTDFTATTGIDVQLSLMPDENKLILANAADYAPDVAVGVNHWIPYEFAIRDASLDLRQFDGYAETVSQFAKGVMIPYAFEEGIYGLPETQNFYVTFYREDIMDALNLPIPGTWEEVIEILPELQSLGMNYYEPLALFKGFKPFVATMPFIYQFGGKLYDEDGMTTLINSEEALEGMKLMTDLFTVYNMPKEITNFYQHFRHGTLPIGIGDLGTYLQLTIAAPEIAGKWSIAPHPGVENDEGEIERWAASGAQSSMILSTSDQPEDSWDFLEWWMSTEVQSEFAIRLQTTYGTEYLWNTANLEAFRQLPLPREHIDIILEQWNYALEASRIPGAYMVEREISNAWNSIVFDDANPRITLDEAAKTANREILYKMEEFDYVVDGIVVKPYIVPTIDNIDLWLTERDDDA
ncbi:MAG: extracellular solute-binding protein [Bacilli bacterium]|nr:extracellular solute-binding protein [Bacilli bacterium]MBN2696027.1 extracellular solute-binding protein [Bacilli bacterium]